MLELSPTAIACAPLFPILFLLKLQLKHTYNNYHNHVGRSVKCQYRTFENHTAKSMYYSVAKIHIVQCMDGLGELSVIQGILFEKALIISTISVCDYVFQNRAYEK